MGRARVAPAPGERLGSSGKRGLWAGILSFIGLVNGRGFQPVTNRLSQRLRRPESRPARGVSTRPLALALIALLLVATSCSEAAPPVAGPEATAQSLVAALAANQRGDFRLTNETAAVEPQAVAAEVFEPLLRATNLGAPDVQLVGVSEPSNGNQAGSTATATLNWRWPFDRADNEEWTYQTTAPLVFVAAVDGGDPAGWAVEWDPSILVPRLLPAERLKVVRTTTPRASILDSEGEAIVEGRPVYRVGIDKTLISPDDLDSSARALVALLAEAGYEYDADNYAARVANAGQRAFVELITFRRDPDVQDITLEAGVTVSEVEHVPGGRAILGSKYLAPTPEFARAILGAVGEATAELIENSDGRLAAGDITGLSGLQRYYDTQLTGTPGYSVKVLDPDGTVVDAIGDIFAIPPVAGVPLVLTLNSEWQMAAERILADVEPGAAIVAIQPSTGAVRVAANGPGSAGLNTALLGQYPPGSTFKVIDALALRRAGLDSDSIVPCTEAINIDGREFGNVPGYPLHALGNVPLRVAFANSCNTAFVSQSSVLSANDLVRAAADLGLGVTSPLGMGAFFGSVPEDPSATEHAADLLGQGLVQASPFTMARVAASVAAGHRVDPYLVDVALREPQYDQAASNLTPEEAAFVLDLMHSVVTDGSATILQDIPGIKGAKTGTAQFGDGSRSHTWMIAIADDLAVAVFVEEGEFGSTTSGPIMHAFLAEVLG